MIAMAVTRFHVEVSGGASAAQAGGLDREDLGGLGALGVEEALASDGAGGSGDDATKVGVRGGEAGGEVGELGGASDETGILHVGNCGRGGGVGVESGVVVRSGFAENGRGVGNKSQRQHHWNLEEAQTDKVLR